MGVYSGNESELKWYVPSFQWRYWGNLLSLFFVFLMAFFSASEVSAFEDDGSWVDGKFFGVNGFGPVGEGPTLQAACSNALGSALTEVRFKEGFAGQWLCLTRTRSHEASHFNCPGGSLSGCDEVPSPPPSDCPEAGTPKRVATAVNGTYENGVFREDIPEGGLRIEIGGSVSAGGCGYAVSTDGSVAADEQVKCSSEGQCFRIVTYVSTGESQEPAADEAWSSVVGDPESTVSDEQDLKSDTRETRSTTTATDPVTENLNGKEVTSQTTTTTETRGDGSVVETQDDVTTVTQSDGITRTDTVTTVTTTNVDGSSTVQTTNNISYTQHPQTIYNIDNSTNRVTVSSAPGTSASSTSTTTDNFSPDGTRTSSETTQGSLDGDQAAQDAAEEAEEEETCQETGNCPESYGEADYGDPESLWESGYPDGITGIFDEAQSRLKQNTLVKGFTSGVFPNSGSLPSFSIPGLSLGPVALPGGEIRLDPRVQPFLIAAFYILTLFVCRRLILGG